MGEAIEKYTASSLEDVANYFETLGSDQIASMRWRKTKRGQDECKVRANVWKDAASILRNTTITGDAS